MLAANSHEQIPLDLDSSPNSDTECELTKQNKRKKICKTKQTMSQNNRITKKALENENQALKQQITDMKHQITQLTGVNPMNNNRFEAIIVPESNINNDGNNMEEETEDEVNNPFQIVKKNIKKRNVNSPTTLTDVTHKQNNKTILPNNKGNIINYRNSNNNNTNHNESSNTLKQKIYKPPPIHVHTQSIKDSIALITGCNIKDFEIKRVNADKHTVITRTLDDFNIIKNVFNDVKTKYFTYTPKNLKCKILVLKGLSNEEDCNDLKQLIETHDGVEIDKITQMRTKRSTNGEYKLPLYIVHCKPNTDIAKLHKIKGLNYQRVNWESLKKSDVILQCRNCQRFGHAAINCKLQFRCVKCHQTHNPGECEITDKIETNNLYCTNCQTKGHPASFKGCPTFKLALQRLRTRINDIKNKHPNSKTFNSLKVSPQNGTFASMFEPKTTAPQQQRIPTSQNNNYNNSSQLTSEQQLSMNALSSKVDQMALIIQQQSEKIAMLLNILTQS